jgi:UDP-N-acetylmuramoylalanine--D-glutamate ligase
MEDAVRLAVELAAPKGTVLLSPACASFDMFANFEERGRAFKEAVADAAGTGAS